MKRETQIKQIKRHLLKGGMISSFEAFSLYGITRLSARIFDLKSAGLPVDYIWSGHGQRQYKSYHLELSYL